MRSYQVVEFSHTLRDAAPRSHAVTAICAKRTAKSGRTPGIRSRVHRLDPTLPLSAKLQVPRRAHCALWKRARLRAEGASNAKIESGFMEQPRLGGMQASLDQTLATSTIAWAKACGAS
jgi:hypothetical protein